MKKTLKVGTVVCLKQELLDNKQGSIGICYEDYKTGSSFIFENGNYDGFSLEEQISLLKPIGNDENASKYVFENVIKLSNDFKEGKFNFKMMKVKKQLFHGI